LTRNRRLLLVTVAVALGLGALLVLRTEPGGVVHHGRADAATRAPEGSGGPRAVAAPTVAPWDPGPPYAVGIVHVTLVDPSRGVAARGPTPASPQRALQVTIRYPAQGAVAGAESADAAAIAGPRALVLFAHGFALTDQTYPRFLHDLAASGFVVADPEFPLSSSALPGPATSGDVVEQARDLGFVADRLLDPTTRPAPLGPVVFDGKLGVVGHSDGGVTAAGFAANSCCADPRVAAAVILSGAMARFPGSWFTTAAPPVLVLHGDADQVNPLLSSQGVYAAARPPKLFAVVSGGSHIGAFEDDTRRPAVVALVADFLRAYVLGDAAAASRLAGDADIPGVLSLRASG
jgi:alpha-beta hydrolase superfamily lysophospholipase